MRASRALFLGSILAGVTVACLKMPGGGPSDGDDDGSGGSGSGGRPSSNIPVCADLFDDACEQPSYEYYLDLCEYENSGAVVDILECVVPSCMTTLDAGVEPCIQNAIQDVQSEDVASLIYDVESVCGSQLDNDQVRVVAIHAASINKRDRLEALAACLSLSYCNEISECLTEPEVAPWWED